MGMLWFKLIANTLITEGKKKNKGKRNSFSYMKMGQNFSTSMCKGAEADKNW